jgi:hypothetical protein
MRFFLPELIQKKLKKTTDTSLETFESLKRVKFKFQNMPKQETANIEKIQSVYEEIVKRIKDGPKTALSYFNAEWSNFSYLEKEILRIFIERFHETILKEDKLPLVMYQPPKWLD